MTSKTDVYRQIRNRIYDLIADLERNPTTKSDAERIRAALRDVKTHRIVKVLRDRESPLSMAIPEDLLRQNESGSAYIEILEMVRKKREDGTHGEISSIESLVSSITKELDLGEDTQIDPTNIGDLLTRISASVQQKHEAGLLNRDQLEKDANAFMSAFSNSPMFQQILSNPAIAAMMTGQGATDNMASENGAGSTE